MLASTVQFSKYGQDHAVDSPRTQNPARRAGLRPSGATAPREPTQPQGPPTTTRAFVPSGPNSVPRSQPEPDHDVPRSHQGSSTSPTGPTTDNAMPAFHPIEQPPRKPRPTGNVWTRSGPWTTTTPTHNKSRGHSSCQMLLRKEVIQPHLPVRLPCYDFVPIASPTFDGSLPKVGPPASGVTDFRDVTGGVYKARERIHRSIADLRLLATPTSRGRVADPDPN